MTKTVITLEGERWDQLSQRLYNSPVHYRAIQAVNPQLTQAILYAPVLPAGLSLNVPDISPEQQVKSVGVAPWRK